MKNLLYNKKMEFVMRIFAGLIIVLLTVINIQKIYGFISSNGADIDFDKVKIVIVNFLVAGLSVFIIIHPQKYGLIAIACFFMRWIFL